MGILINESGLYTTIQDYGRIGYQEAGFSVCGAMDKRSLTIANLLVGNREDEACIEATLIGPKIEFTDINIIAITGGNLNPKINGKYVNMYEAIIVKRGDILSFTNAVSGARAYIAFAGGLDIENTMGSKSTNVKCNIGGYRGRNLKSGDCIGFISPKDYLPNFASRKLEIKENKMNEKNISLRVILGPQEDAFTKEGIETFFNSTYEVTKDFDRMGCRLDGPEIEHKESADIISDGIVLGSIQIPSHKKPIIMLTDRQTTGGYTKIGTVITIDIPKLAQAKVGDEIKFELINIEKAQKLYREEELSIEIIKKQINKPCLEVLNPRKASQRISELLIKVN
ncbi:MAG: biotin-dependent carboxyltransferase family protein [Peptostreptococcaceae bacterium]